jgi:hypothetical protein
MINIPLYILIGIVILGLGIDIGRHNQPKEGIHNAWATLIAGIIELGLIIWAVYW